MNKNKFITISLSAVLAMSSFFIVDAQLDTESKVQLNLNESPSSLPQVSTESSTMSAPLAPTNVSATASSTQSTGTAALATVSWTDNSNNESNFIITPYYQGATTPISNGGLFVSATVSRKPPKRAQAAPAPAAKKAKNKA